MFQMFRVFRMDRVPRGAAAAAAYVLHVRPGGRMMGGSGRMPGGRRAPPRPWTVGPPNSPTRQGRWPAEVDAPVCGQGRAGHESITINGGGRGR